MVSKISSQKPPFQNGVSQGNYSCARAQFASRDEVWAGKSVLAPCRVVSSLGGAVCGKIQNILASFKNGARRVLGFEKVIFSEPTDLSGISRASLKALFLLDGKFFRRGGFGVFLGRLLSGKSLFYALKGWFGSGGSSIRLEGVDGVLTLSCRKKGGYLLFDIQKEGDVLGICFSKEGKVCDVFLNGTQTESQTVPSEWKESLDEVIGHLFLKEGFQMAAHNDEVSAHPLALELQPLPILREIRRHVEAHQNLPRVRFLDNRFLPTPGIDAGGPRRQFLNDLCRNLFSNFSGSILNIELGSKIPTINPSASQARLAAQREALQDVGALMAFCQKSGEEGVDEGWGWIRATEKYSMGRILPDHYFDILKKLMEAGVDGEISDDCIIESGRYLREASADWSFQIALGERAITQEEQEMVNGGTDPDNEEAMGRNILYLQVEGNDYAGALRQDLLEKYRPFVDAALIVARAFPEAQREEWRRLSAAEMNEKIQGMAYDKERVAALVVTHSEHPVIQQKVAWLREFIHERDEEWGKSLLKTVTGSDSITGSTRININEVYGSEFCAAHTCSQALDVPTTHTSIGTSEGEEPDDKQKFFNNLMLTLSSKDSFDMG